MPIKPNPTSSSWADPRAIWFLCSGCRTRFFSATTSKAIEAWSTQRPQCGAASADRCVHQRLCLGEDLLEVILVTEAFAVDLVDRLGAGRPCREPAVFRDHFDTA